MSQSRPHIFDLSPQSLADHVTGWGLPRYRADQVLHWVYQRQVIDPALMTDLSARDRGVLAEKLTFLRSSVVQHQVATDGVQKLLVEWDQANGGSGAPAAPAQALPVLGQRRDAQTECVMIPAGDESQPERGEPRSRARKTSCISSQIGCPVGCRFCASGLGGLDGNLTAGQIVEQVWRLGALPQVGRITNVVFMGMGEPLSNFDEVTRAIATMMADWGLHISGRRITLSTVGLPAQMRRLADLELPVTLAISLHAPNDEIRRRLIPWAQYVTIEQLLDAGRYYFQRTGREVTLEYTLLRNVNDRPEHARELAHVARTLRGNVNLIRYNEVKDLPFNRPATEDVRAFQAILQKHGVNTHIRASRGRDIAAACGQLRHEHAGA
jgi:23S rRNA (adenine2503-C2)-methyltransferase